jgi:hypothetical protein
MGEVKVARKKEYVYFRESALQSFLADIGTYAVLVGSFYVNYKFIGNDGFLAGILLVAFVLFSIAKAGNKSKTYTNKEDLIKHLQDE